MRTRPVREAPVYEAAKRATDIVVSAVGLLAVAPLGAAIAWRVRREDYGPVIFRGLRVGRHGRTFRILKFRSMAIGADQLGLHVTPGDDPSLTPTGRFLRRWKLDELPQLVNVLRGEMSLVGPRPPTVWDAEHYDEQQKHLLDVRPGITDWASIRYRNQDMLIEGRADPHVAYFEMIRPGKLDLAMAYVQNRSYVVDLGILGLTALALLRHPRTDELLQRMVTSVRARV
ncbi:sugar transferase [Paractinoplanes ferrugineus]|uniref:Glycosyl transferase n=1 Tax=Paractinoplanes ferrugineus TaxID=113564 RepID=A0A919J2T7_9ACTN|nr:sugar transferase [Actinoplanes ferrugineus]GIE12893.1 glycosyl transferase [Actinoplanes ferrugineus]